MLARNRISANQQARILSDQNNCLIGAIELLAFSQIKIYCTYHIELIHNILVLYQYRATTAKPHILLNRFQNIIYR